MIPAIAKGRSPAPFTAGSPLDATLIEAGGFVDVFVVSADGTRLHAVEDDGKRRVAGKRAIVFVHGFPELWVSWQSQLATFAAAGHPVLALSMRGYGLSDKPGGVANYDTVPLTQDIAAAVAHAATANGADSAGKPLLVAHDWGAGVCWAYVSHAGGDASIAGYASLSNPPSEAFAKNMGASQIWASAYMIFFNAARLPEWILLLGSAWFTGLILNDVETEAIEPRLMDAYRANVLQPGAMTAQLDYYRAALTGGSDAAKAMSKANRLGPRKSGGEYTSTPHHNLICGDVSDRLLVVVGEARKLALPVLLVRGKQDIGEHKQSPPQTCHPGMCMSACVCV